MKLPRLTIGQRTLLGVLPTVLIIGALMVVPMGIMAAFSLMESGAYGGVAPHLSFDSYIQILYQLDFDDNLVFDNAYLLIFWRSIWLAAATTAITLVIGFPVAYYIATRPPRARAMLILLITVPFWTNLLIRTYSWLLILRDTGLMNSALLNTGVIAEPLPLLYTDIAILFGLVYTYAPFMVLPIYTSLERLDFRLVEAARDLYCGRLGALRHVVLPLVAPGILAGAVLVFVPSLGAFIAPDLLGGGKKLMIGSLIQLQFSSSRNWPFGAALALLLMALVMLALLAAALKRKRGDQPLEVH